MARFEGQRPVTPTRVLSSGVEPSTKAPPAQDAIAHEVKQMRHDEVAFRLAGEKEELMGRLAQHGYVRLPLYWVLRARLYARTGARS